jgi:hypothetical protein
VELQLKMRTKYLIINELRFSQDKTLKDIKNVGNSK